MAASGTLDPVAFYVSLFLFQAAAEIQLTRTGSGLDIWANVNRQCSTKDMFIRGSVVRYVHLPSGAVDTALLEDATRREAEAAKNKAK